MDGTHSMHPSYPENRRVVITGAGILTSMGHGWRENADGFREGRLAFRPITVFDTSRQRVGMAGEVVLPAQLPPHALGGREAARLDRASILLLHAAAEAWEAAGWDDSARAEPLPLCLGTSAGAMALGEAYYRQATETPGRRLGQPGRIRNYQTHRQAIHLAGALGFSGPVTIISNACASGANAIGHAFQLIRRGECDRAFAGGYDALASLVFAGFDSLQALTTRMPPRPFDAHRDGLALGEGAAMLTLESLASARRRGAEILAELVGYGISTDLHHLTQPHPEGDAALRSMEQACREAGLRAADIDYLNSHGTGTPLNDIAEGRAIQRWAGGDVARIRVSSTKAGIGHLLGGAGAVETVISLMALREGFLPPTTTVETPDPVCTFDLVREPREARVRRVLTNSFGFGGANATLILSAFDESHAVSGSGHRNPVGIAIRGRGAVSPAGWSAAALDAVLAVPDSLAPPEQTLREGRAMPVPVRRVPPPVEKFPFLRDPRLRRASAVARYGVSAALEAVGESRWEAIRSGASRLGIVYALVNGCVHYSARFYGEVIGDPSLASPILFPETVYNAPASHLAALLGSTGPCYTLVGDSAQFVEALKVAARWIEDGDCDGVVVVGTEEHHWLCAEAVQLFAPAVVFSEGAGALYLEAAGPGESDPCLTRILGPDLYTAENPRAGVVARLAAQFSEQPCLIGDPTLFDRKNGDPALDAAESAAWAEHRGKSASPAVVLGESLGAAVAWQAVLASGSAPAIVSAAGENEQAAVVAIGDRPILSVL
jgi:3-oxoacyl-[acyl-carrier-protein] synthase II